jgi:hypothetical protein
MKAFKNYFVFLMLALGLSASCFAAANQSQPCDNYYIQQGGVYVVPNGIYVLFNGELVKVNTLSSDANGVFVPGIEMSRQFVWCPICEHWYDPEQPHYCK